MFFVIYSRVEALLLYPPYGNKCLVKLSCRQIYSILFTVQMIFAFASLQTPHFAVHAKWIL